MYHNATCIFLFLLGQLQAEIPVPSYCLEMKTFTTHWAATSLELCLNNDFYATHPIIETKIGENPDHHKYSIQCGMEWQSGTKLEKNSGEESINKCILREAMYHTRNRNWGTLLCVLTLSSVVGHQNQICLSIDR